MISLNNDFTFASYKQLLENFISRGYTFVSDASMFSSSSKCILNRHDVDFYPSHALRLAEIENDLGLKSSYYFLLDSVFYNLLSNECYEIVQKIRDLGHDVNLHIDGNYGCSDLESFRKKLSFQKNLWEGFFNYPLSSFTFHMNNEFTKNCNDLNYEGLLNSGLLARLPEVSYISDSNGFWGNDPSFEYKSKLSQKILLLTHPVWWSEVKMTPYERFESFLKSLDNQKRKWYSDVVKKYSRPYPGRENG